LAAGELRRLALEQGAEPEHLGGAVEPPLLLVGCDFAHL